MPWELTIVNYDGEPPRFVADSNRDRHLPLGTLEEVRAYISSVLPKTQWVTEPPLIEIMKRSGSDSWKEWDAESIASASRPKLKAHYEADGVSFEMYGFDQNGPVQYFLLEVRGDQNPIPTLRTLCSPKGWSAHEMCRGAEFLDLNLDRQGRWSVWEKFRDFAIGRARRRSGDDL